MPQKSDLKNEKRPAGPSIWGLLLPYRGLIALLVALTVFANALNLVVPKIIATAIDSYSRGNFGYDRFIVEFALAAAGIFLFTYLQNIAQVYASERVARDLRSGVLDKISRQPYGFISGANPSKLLTNLTSDVDAIKGFVSQAIAALISSFFLIIGASALLFWIDWRLASAVLVVVPIIGVTFFFVLGRVRKLFKLSQEAIDGLNAVITESILGAAIIRIVNAQGIEYQKFMAANANARDIGLRILRLFSSLIPVITFCTNLATLIILCLGGHYVIEGSLTLGNFTAFNNYLAILIFPILIIGFMSNVIAQATASYERIRLVLDSPDYKEGGSYAADMRGEVQARDVSLQFGEKKALKNISFTAKHGSKTAIIGPTAAGKSQLLYLLSGLEKPTSGSISYDGKDLQEYDPASLHGQVALVFQDSVMFNLSVRENVAFSKDASSLAIDKAIETAELSDFLHALPQGLDTLVSERGTSLSGGQKQRIMLARALALNPKVLLLDDFTARVDTKTERAILKNLAENYPELTLISVTQKISSVEQFDQILLLEDGEILARGKHDELLRSSPEYVQIFESQKSTNEYELQA